MSSIWLVTGPPGVGKSTVVSRVVTRLKSTGVIVGGCVTRERKAEGRRVGFDLLNLTDGTRGELASLSSKLGPWVGKYRVNLTDLSAVGAAGLATAAEGSELIVIDELGPMELVSPEFRRAVRKCIDSGKPILAVIHERLEDDLLAEVRSKANTVVELTQETRDRAVDELADAILALVGSSKPS